MHPTIYPRLAISSFFLVCVSAMPAAAWTPATQVTIAREAARLSPPDLFRQIDKHRRAYAEGVNAPFADSDANRHAQNPDGSGYLTRAALNDLDSAIPALRSHQAFD